MGSCDKVSFSPRMSLSSSLGTYLRVSAAALRQMASGTSVKILDRSACLSYELSSSQWSTKSAITRMEEPVPGIRNNRSIMPRRLSGSSTVARINSTVTPSLEAKFDVVVITQNIDDLHERAGSSNVIHIHGDILKARSSADPSLVYVLAKPTIELGETCEKGSQLRPDVVWFGEDVRCMEECVGHFLAASRIITLGTSLTVYPAASLVKKSSFSAEKYLVSPEAQKVPYGFRFLRGTAATVMPHVATCWLDGRKPV